MKDLGWDIWVEIICLLHRREVYALSFTCTLVYNIVQNILPCPVGRVCGASMTLSETYPLLQKAISPVHTMYVHMDESTVKLITLLPQTHQRLLLASMFISGEKDCFLYLRQKLGMPVIDKNSLKLYTRLTWDVSLFSILRYSIMRRKHSVKKLVVRSLPVLLDCYNKPLLSSTRMFLYLLLECFHQGTSLESLILSGTSFDSFPFLRTSAALQEMDANARKGFEYYDDCLPPLLGQRKFNTSSVRIGVTLRTLHVGIRVLKIDFYEFQHQQHLGPDVIGLCMYIKETTTLRKCTLSHIRFVYDMDLMFVLQALVCNPFVNNIMIKNMTVTRHIVDNLDIMKHALILYNSIPGKNVGRLGRCLEIENIPNQGDIAYPNEVSSIRKLSLRMVRMLKEGFQALTQYTLVELELTRSGIDTSFYPILSSWLSKASCCLEKLTLKGNLLTANHISVFGEGLRRNTSLSYLNLNENFLGLSGFTALLDYSPSQLRQLHVRQNTIYVSCSHLHHLFQTKELHLETIDLAFNMIVDVRNDVHYTTVFQNLYELRILV